jgi:hypothetical protein
VTRTWRKGDVVKLRFPMSVRVFRGHEGPYPQEGYFKRPGSKLTQVNRPFASVYAGPLLFALPIADESPNTVQPGAKWQYALDVANGREGSAIRVERHPMPASWRWQLEAPVTLRVPARTFDWNPTEEQSLPDEPVTGGEAASISLVPYGCAKFRISMFPVTSKAWQTQ